MTRKITREDLVTAFARTELHRDQIQGFTYANKEEGYDQHVARDLLCEHSSQAFWIARDDGTVSNYDKLHGEMLIAIEERQMQLVANELNSLLQEQ